MTKRRQLTLVPTGAFFLQNDLDQLERLDDEEDISPKLRRELEAFYHQKQASAKVFQQKLDARERWVKPQTIDLAKQHYATNEQLQKLLYREARFKIHGKAQLRYRDVHGRYVKISFDSQGRTVPVLRPLDARLQIALRRTLIREARARARTLPARRARADRLLARELKREADQLARWQKRMLRELIKRRRGK